MLPPSAGPDFLVGGWALALGPRPQGDGTGASAGSGEALPFLGAGQPESFGNVNTKSEGVGARTLLKTVRLSQTLKSHEWKDVGLAETKTANQTQTPNPQPP